MISPAQRISCLIRNSREISLCFSLVGKRCNGAPADLAPPTANTCYAADSTRGAQCLNATATGPDSIGSARRKLCSDFAIESCGPDSRQLQRSKRPARKSRNLTRLNPRCGERLSLSLQRSSLSICVRYRTKAYTVLAALSPDAVLPRLTPSRNS